MNTETIRAALALTLSTVLAASAVSLTFVATRDRIAANRIAAAEAPLLQIIPGTDHDNTLLNDSVIVDDNTLLGLRAPQSAYLARRGGEVVAVLLPVIARDGYGGDIELLVGIDRSGTVTGVRALTHRETPGLGDRIERDKSEWVETFVGRSLGDPVEALWRVKKDDGYFDQLTGATVTSRATTAAVARALQYAETHKQMLFGATVDE